jgi:CPA2 family monovalent cation:H+ antiporter-2
MSEFVTSITIILVASSVMLLLLDRFSHPALPAYILAGALISNYIDQSTTFQFAQLGIIFLVFVYGLKTDLGRLAAVAEESLSTTLVTIVIIGSGSYILGLQIGLDTINAAYFSLAATISSSLVGLELIEDDLRAGMLHGRLAESIHLTQDAIAILFILVATAITTGDFVSSIAGGFAIIGAALLFRQYLLQHAAEFVERSQELTMLISLATIAAFIGVTEMLNLSTIIGSFAAGISLAKFPYNVESLDTIKPLKDFFSAITFVSLGTLIVIPSATTLTIVVVLLLITLVLKPLLTAFYLMEVGYDSRTAYLTGFSLDQVSEFSLLIGMQAIVAGTIIRPLFEGLVIAGVLTMIVSSYTVRHEEKLYRKLSDLLEIRSDLGRIKERSEVAEVKDHVIVLGYGTQGESIVEELEKTGKEFVLIENDPEKVTEASKKVENYVFGDALDSKTWKAARHQEAALIVSTIPSMKISERILSLESPAQLILRTPEIKDAATLMQNGAYFVEVPDVMAAEQLVDHIHGVQQEDNYREELRRKNLLELRKYLRTENR